MKTPMRIALGLALMTGSLLGAQSTPREPLPAIYGVTVYCTLPGKGAMGIGWTEPSEGKYYRCLPTFDESFKPTGAAWVQVEKGGTIGARLPL